MSLVMRLLPRGPRKRAIDAVYGSAKTTGLHGYWMALTFLWLVLCMFLTSLIWDWPASEGRVETFAPVRCEAFRADYSTSVANSTAAVEDSAAAPTCDEQLGDLRPQFVQASQIGDSLREEREPEYAAARENSPLRGWMDASICRLGGATSLADRAHLAWRVRHGLGDCSGFARTTAGFPLTILLGVVPGIFLTSILMLVSGYFLLGHLLRLRSTRLHYRRLFGSEHKAP